VKSSPQSLGSMRPNSSSATSRSPVTSRGPSPRPMLPGNACDTQPLASPRSTRDSLQTATGSELPGADWMTERLNAFTQDKKRLLKIRIGATVLNVVLVVIALVIATNGSSSRIPDLFSRISASFTSGTNNVGLDGVLAILAGLIFMPLFGRLTRLMSVFRVPQWNGQTLILALFTFATALLKEVVYRVMCVPPHLGFWSFANLLAMLAFTIGFADLVHTAEGFLDPRFTVLVIVRGLICSIAWVGTQSVWPPILLHFWSMYSWLVLWGGAEKMRFVSGVAAPRANRRRPSPHGTTSLHNLGGETTPR